jgi:hypothetical protein
MSFPDGYRAHLIRLEIARRIRGERPNLLAPTHQGWIRADE